MNTRRIDGLLFEGMLKNGFAALQNKEKELNDLNVFPVPDGDTGTNMRLTLGNGISNAKSSVKLCDYMRKLSDGMLRSTREFRSNSLAVVCRNEQLSFTLRCSFGRRSA